MEKSFPEDILFELAVFDIANSEQEDIWTLISEISVYMSKKTKELIYFRGSNTTLVLDTYITDLSTEDTVKFVSYLLEKINA